MAKFCSNEECIRYEHPLRRDASRCRECRTTELRVTDTPTVRCDDCDSPNAGASGECWDCGATVSEGSRTLRL